MAVPADSNLSPVRSSSLGRLTTMSFAAVILLVSVRAGCEWAMMWEYGSDAQMAVWVMFSLVALAFWLATGIVLAGLIAASSKRWAALICSLLLVGNRTSLP